jgi:hypothetical protein
VPFTGLADSLAKCKNLTSFHIGRRKVYRDEGFPAVLSTVFASLPRLRSATLPMIWLTDDNVKQIADLLTEQNLKDNNNSLTELNLTSRALGSSYFPIHLSPLFKKEVLYRIRSLDFCRTFLGDLLPKTLAQLFADLPNLTFLNLSNTALGQVGCCAIAENLPKSRIQLLNLSRNFQVSEPGCLAVSKALPLTKTLWDLDLSFCEISITSARELAEAVLKSPQLKVLGLSGGIQCKRLSRVSDVFAAVMKKYPQLALLD